MSAIMLAALFIAAAFVAVGVIAASWIRYFDAAKLAWADRHRPVRMELRVTISEAPRAPVGVVALRPRVRPAAPARLPVAA